MNLPLNIKMNQEQILIKDTSLSLSTLPLIECKNSGIHCTGVYTKEDIPKATKIIEYVGELISKEEGDKRADEQEKKSKENPKYGRVYIFDLNKKYDLDGNFPWNLARFINHSCKPNCKYKKEGNKIWIVSKRNVKKGEEITFDYGYDLKDYKEHVCKCRSDNCIGFIIGKSYWKKFRELNVENKTFP